MAACTFNVAADARTNSVLLLGLLLFVCLAAMQLQVADAQIDSSQLSRGETLYAGQYLFRQDGLCLKMQSDCNLVYRSGAGDIWNTNMSNLGYTGCYFRMENTGNAVLYGWWWGWLYRLYQTNTHDGTYIQLQKDCNVVMYNSAGTAVWSTGTNCDMKPTQINTLSNVEDPDCPF